MNDREHRPSSWCVPLPPFAIDGHSFVQQQRRGGSEKLCGSGAAFWANSPHWTNKFSSDFHHPFNLFEDRRSRWSPICLDLVYFDIIPEARVALRDFSQMNTFLIIWCYFCWPTFLAGLLLVFFWILIRICKYLQIPHWEPVAVFENADSGPVCVCSMAWPRKLDENGLCASTVCLYAVSLLPHEEAAEMQSDTKRPSRVAGDVKRHQRHAAAFNYR